MASTLSNTVCGPLFSQLKQSRARFHAGLQASVNGLPGGGAFGMSWLKAWRRGTGWASQAGPRLWGCLESVNTWHRAPLRRRLSEPSGQVYSSTDGPRECYTKWSQTEEEEYRMTSLTWGILKNNTSNINRLMDFQKEITVAGGKDGIVREFGKDMDTLLYLKRITSNGLLYSTWNPAQC